MIRRICGTLLICFLAANYALATENGDDNDQEDPFCGKILHFPPRGIHLPPAPPKPPKPAPPGLPSHLDVTREKMLLENARDIYRGNVNAIRFLVRLATEIRPDNVQRLIHIQTARVTMLVMNEAYKKCVENLPLYQNEPLLKNEQLGPIAAEINEQFLRFHLIVSDPRFAKVLETVGVTLDPLTPYDQKLIKDFLPHDVAIEPKWLDWTFEYPNQPTDEHLKVQISNIQSEIEETREAAQTITNTNLDRFAQKLYAVAEDLTKFTLGIVDDLPPDPAVLEPIDNLYFYALQLLESEEVVKIVREEQAGSEITRFRRLPIQIGQLKILRERLRARGLN